MSVLRRIGILATELATALRGADSYTLDLVFRSMPGLYEWLWDQAPEGSGDQVVIGEDHSGSANNGGIEIPKNAIVSVGNGSDTEWMWELLGLVGSTGWTNADVGYTASRGTALGYHWWGYVDVGLDTTTHPTLFVEAWVAIYSPDDLDVRILGSGGASATTAVTGYGQIQFVKIDDIPVIGGVWNDFTLQFLAPDETGIDVYTYGAVIAEVYRGGGKNDTQHAAPLSQPPQAGTTEG